MTDLSPELEGAIRRIVEAAIEAAIPRIVAALEQAGRSAPDGHLPDSASEFDRELARVVEQIWRDQNRRPAVTAAVAVRIGYSHDYTLDLLKDAERAGVVASIPARGRRHSGRWIPVSQAA